MLALILSILLSCFQAIIIIIYWVFFYCAVWSYLIQMSLCFRVPALNFSRHPLFFRPDFVAKRCSVSSSFIWDWNRQQSCGPTQSTQQVSFNLSLPIGTNTEHQGPTKGPLDFSDILQKKYISNFFICVTDQFKRRHWKTL